MHLRTGEKGHLRFQHTLALVSAQSSVAQFPKVHVNNRLLMSGFSAINKSLLGPHVLTGPALKPLKQSDHKWTQ